MEIRIAIDAPRGWARRCLLLVATPLALVAAGALWAHASGVPNTFSANQILSASQMNANFAAATTAAFDGGLFSVGPTLFVGPTAAKTPGDMSGYSFGSGYSAAKKACESSFPSRPTVHMCSGDEITRSIQLGVTLAVGWFSVPLFAIVGTTPQSTATDCNGWTTTDGTLYGPSLRTAGNGLGPYALPCNDPEPILCCD